MSVTTMDALITEYAMRLSCGYCGAAVRKPCHLKGLPRARAGRTHAARLAPFWEPVWEAYRLGVESGRKREAKEAVS